MADVGRDVPLQVPDALQLVALGVRMVQFKNPDGRIFIPEGEGVHARAADDILAGPALRHKLPEGVLREGDAGKRNRGDVPVQERIHHAAVESPPLIKGREVKIVLDQLADFLIFLLAHHVIGQVIVINLFLSDVGVISPGEGAKLCGQAFPHIDHVMNLPFLMKKYKKTPPTFIHLPKKMKTGGWGLTEYGSAYAQETPPVPGQQHRQHRTRRPGVPFP